MDNANANLDGKVKNVNKKDVKVIRIAKMNKNVILNLITM